MGCGASSGAAELPTSKDAGKLMYFAGIRSRGEPCRIIAACGKVTLADELISIEAWAKIKSDKIKTLPQIKQIVDGKETMMGETEDICKFLAQKGGVMVVDEKQAELCHMANTPPLCLADPLYNMPGGGAHLGVPSYEKWLTLVKPVIAELVTKLGAGPFFAGEQPGYGEAYIWHIVDNIMKLAKDDIKLIGINYKLVAFHTKFAALDGVKEYLASRPVVFGVPGSKANPVNAACSQL